MTQHYFATDGNYGDAKGMVVIDTTHWTRDQWDYIENLSEGQRAEVTEDIAAGKGSIDQQDCPHGWQEEDPNTGAIREVECGFVGQVYRAFYDPERGEEGGYTWECPNCETAHDWEGEDDLISEPTA